jgi:hypothetical protein
MSRKTLLWLLLPLVTWPWIAGMLTARVGSVEMLIWLALLGLWAILYVRVSRSA